jgi:Uma2 family endonuclease
MSPRMNPRPNPLKPATMADLEALPPNVKGEIIEGVLHVLPRPRSRHSNATSCVDNALKGPFQFGRGGPGGWWILVEPGIELPGSPEVAPDLAAWRRERLPSLPDDRSIDVVPDWVCEILSPTTRAYDLRVKRPFYARVGVRHLWYIDLQAQSLTVSQLEGGRWVELDVYGGDDIVRAEPFEAIEMALAEWWMSGPPPSPAP